MPYLGIENDELISAGAIHTAREIAQQPDVWLQIFAQFEKEFPLMISFWEKVMPKTKRIILTGAGTSAYIGLSLQGCYQQLLQIPTHAIATTDIVSHPHDHLLAKEPTLLISFARSGDSPESAAVVSLVEEICETCFHLIITCNPQGALVQQATRQTSYTFMLPEKTNDISLAMTSSYSSMLLAGLLFAHLPNLAACKSKVVQAANYGAHCLDFFCETIREITERPFDRVVFLGSGPLTGTATEATLKILELTGGRVTSLRDTYLGFRHGPKSVINGQTLMVYFLSSGNHHSMKYETDLIENIKKGTEPMIEIAVSETYQPLLNIPRQLFFANNLKIGDEHFLCLPFIIIGQLLGFYKSINLKLKPDTPSENNDINRVVEGVTIYELQT